MFGISWRVSANECSWLCSNAIGLEGAHQIYEFVSSASENEDAFTYLELIELDGKSGILLDFNYLQEKWETLLNDFLEEEKSYYFSKSFQAILLDKSDSFHSDVTKEMALTSAEPI